jgi:hypothetical protein
MLRHLSIAAVVLTVTGCGQVYYPPPPQIVPQPHPVMEILDMTGGRPSETWGSVVAGVQDSGDPNLDWRWATAQSLFHFKLDEFEGWRFIARITAARTVLDKTGPQHVAFKVNGQTVGAVALDASRRYDLSFPVDAALLKSATPIVVNMDAGPCVPQQYGEPFCVLLHRIGFVKDPGGASH